jgi:hypothetical protein
MLRLCPVHLLSSQGRRKTAIFVFLQESGASIELELERWISHYDLDICHQTHSVHTLSKNLLSNSVMCSFGTAIGTKLQWVGASYFGDIELVI